MENSIWGTSKSSGCFSTLFESRLLRAKRYLDSPFELAIERDEKGLKTGTRKIMASAPIEVLRVNTWKDLVRHDKTLLVLNGDSSRMPIPAASVDAVITDPPYFDFVHYSELSDFFFAWLSPVLADRYPWMNRADSSDEGEVQHKDPRVFSRQLSKVFTECCRVLKDDGILAFSFHHSRPHGWAAIYEAIETSGLKVVSAHPVHAELRGANPKNAAKDPISLDAILVCRKRRPGQRLPGINGSLIVRAESQARLLEKSALQISSSDRFVIAASQLLIDAGPEALTYEDILARLVSLKLEL